MKPRDLKKLGVPAGAAVAAAVAGVDSARRSGVKKSVIRARVKAVLADPARHVEDPHFGPLAAFLAGRRAAADDDAPRHGAAPYRTWGHDLDANSIRQMDNACRLPVSVRGALMPDAHLGYGLPIGGVLATRGAVIPYAVGVDIACRMKMSVYDIPPERLDDDLGPFKKAIADETRFGIGASFRDRRQHAVMDRNWTVTPVTAKLKDRAWSQLGTSGSGNHFVEFGTFTLREPAPDLALDPGTYLALLSHSGSRGAGANVAGHYSRIARRLHPGLPRELTHLAWLGFDTQEGREYWDAMQLMGRYAAANHACIHRAIAKHLGATVVLDLENHHNFAWLEEHDGEQVVVHRKGATPAGRDVLGIIPGSMASPTYIVRGMGNPESMNSAAHGAGRVMSRGEARRSLHWSHARQLLDARGVTLMSAGLDEVPMVYKDIDAVMAAQSDLVEPIASFFPRLVKMAPAGERPED